jgi:hypothetical protein
LSELIEHSYSGSERLVSVGESQSPVSLKVYQAIYHQVTGRTEQIRKRYTENLLVDFSELEQLNHKVIQLCDIHNIIAKNVTISVFHDKERKEQFTTFERFRAYNANTSSPTVSLVLKYNFSIIPAGLKNAQEYVVNIRLTSKVALMRQMDDEAPSFMRGRLFEFMGGRAAEITIDYADYVIARGFLESFDEWVSGCKTTPKSSVLNFLRNYSHNIPTFAQLALAVIAVIYGLQAIPAYFTAVATPLIGARFFVIYSGGAYILLNLVRMSGELIERAIDSFPEMSYLSLNKGDEKLIAEAKLEKPKVYFKLIAGCIASILISIISAKLEKFI